MKRTALCILSLTFLAAVFLLTAGDSRAASVYDDAVSYWTFDDADISGNTIADKEGSNNGTIYNATTNQAGMVNQSFYFNGNTNSYINIGTTGVPTGNSARTVSIWAQSTLTSVDQDYLIGWGTAGNNQEFAVSIMGNRLTVDGYFAYSMTNYVVQKDEWHLYTITHDGTKTEAYVDGNKLAWQYTHNWDTGIANGLEIARRATQDLGNFTGYIDDAAIWNTALTADEILILAQTRYVASGISDLGLSYLADEMNQLAYLYGDSLHTPVSIDGIDWTYLAGTLPGDDGSRAIGEGWAYGGDYYIKLGSGLKGETGGAAPEPATVVSVLSCIALLNLRRLAGKYASRTS